MIRIGDILARRGPYSDQYSTRRSQYSDVQDLNFSTSQIFQQPFFPPRTSSYYRPQVVQPAMYPPQQYAQEQDFPAWTQQQPPQQPSRWPTENPDETGLRTADTTLDDDFEAQMGSL